MRTLSPIEFDQINGNDTPVLVVVVNQPLDLHRALELGWYRIPLDRAPSRVAAEYLAFYQTGAFPPKDRFVIRRLAPVRGYVVATRRELIPEEPDHSRADWQYYKVLLGDSVVLPNPIPSRRLRRIAFIPTTLSRLLHAEEINDLWIRSTAQQRLWEALRQSGLDGENQYPLQDDLTEQVADFALFCRSGRIAVIIGDEHKSTGRVEDDDEAVTNYLALSGKWRLFKLRTSEIEEDANACARRLLELACEMGGIVDQ
jgi:very-short-patch-repair endonuclease